MTAWPKWCPCLDCFAALSHVIPAVPVSDLMTVLCACTEKDTEFTMQRRMYLAWLCWSSGLASFTHFPFLCPPPLLPRFLLINDRSSAWGLARPQRSERVLAARLYLALSVCKAPSAFQVWLLSRATLVKIFLAERRPWAQTESYITQALRHSHLRL